MTHFAHLHTHSDASLVDGLGKVGDLVTSAVELGFEALALTDHGSLTNSMSFTMAAQEAGLKPIVGLEAYVSYRGTRHHLTLLADGNPGFVTLVELNNEGKRGADTRRPTFPLERLWDLNDGVVMLTGCPQSPFQATLWPDAEELLREAMAHLPDRVFVEMMLPQPGSAHHERAQHMLRQFRLPHVMTNDVHFPLPGQAEAHKVLVQLKANFNYESDHLYLTTQQQLEQRVERWVPALLPLAQAGMRNAARLARDLHPVEFDARPKLPHIPDAEGLLQRKAEAGLLVRGLTGQQYYDRLTSELSVINNAGFATYFLILEDIVGHARDIGCWVGPGRGSGAGSLVLYLLRVTDVDPLVYDLSFDRFLNSARTEMPDVDVDFEAELRPLVLEYAAKRWGGMPVATYSRYSHKSLTHDLAKYYRAPRELEAKAAEQGPDGPAFKELVHHHPQLVQVYDSMLGQIRHVGQHAGGIVIVEAGQPVPLERTSSGDLVAAFQEGEWRELTRAGIVKFDLLGLAAGSVLRRLETKLKRKAEPLVDDDPVFELFRDGDTLGIFQFAGSQGIIDFTRRVAPTTFEDLVAINALYRPGALDSGAADEYPDLRHSGSQRSLHPLVDDLLRSTYGVICYQEQFMAIMVRVTGGTMAEADLARKVLSKARPGQPDWEIKYAKLQLQFTEGCRKQGLTDVEAARIWDEIKTHTRYSFNRSHAVAYAQVAAEMAWWKYHHRSEFYAAMLSVDRDDWQRYLFDVVASGLELVAPHVNAATADFEADGDKVRLPLSIVRFLGEAGVRSILEHRPYASLEDFMARVPKLHVKSQARRGLLALGAFEGLPHGDEPHKVLQVKALEKLTAQGRQREFMGLILPTKRDLDLINLARAQGWVAGIVNTKERRTSKFGAYYVYTLLPEGAAWTRGAHEDVEVGDKVKVRLKADTGKILELLPLG